MSFFAGWSFQGLRPTGYDLLQRHREESRHPRGRERRPAAGVLRRNRTLRKGKSQFNPLHSKWNCILWAQAHRIPSSLFRLVQKVLYRINRRTGECTTTSLDTPFRPIAVPPNATYYGTYYVGSTVDPLAGFKVNSFGGDTDNGRILDCHIHTYLATHIGDMLVLCLRIVLCSRSICRDLVICQVCTSHWLLLWRADRICPLEVDS